MSEGNGVGIEGFGTKINANGIAIYPVLLLISFAITIGSLMYVIDSVGTKIELAVKTASNATMQEAAETTSMQRALQNIIENSFMQTSKEHNRIIYNYQIDMCIRHIEKTQSPVVRQWYWERWNNKEQLKVICPWLD